MIVTGNSYSANLRFVSDGDTLNLDCEGEQINARLQWIDTPETKKSGKNSSDLKVIKHWEWAEKAKSTLIEITKKGKLILIPAEKDFYGRWVCDLYIGRISSAANVQIRLCKAGMATTYLPFNRHSYNSRELSLLRGIITEAANANEKKIGIWSEPDFIYPYEFKKLTF